MTLRLSALAALALAVAGCNGGGGGADVREADSANIAEADALQQFAYSAGFQQAQGYVQQDSLFNYDRFVDGFRAGLDGDSAEVAYAVGLQLGFELAQDTLGVVDRGYILAGVRDAIRGDSNRVSDEQFQAATEAFQDSLFVRQLRGQAAGGDETARQRLSAVTRNAATADSFLTAVAARDGVQQLEEGVYYETTTPGDGASPGPTDRVQVRYRGQFPNGTVFDESGEEPTTFGVNQVVPGFSAALRDMQVGETRTVYLAPDQAYGLRGQQGAGPSGGIPPNSALQFEITLLDVAPGIPQGLPPQLQGLGQ